MSEIPSIKVLEAINPANSGTGEEALAYNGLAAAVEKYKPTNAQRTTEFWDSEAGSLEELSKAKQLASEYLLRTAEQVVDSNQGNRDLWANRFTLATTELYGEPERAEVAHLLSNEYNSLLQLRGDDRVSQQHVQILLDTYRPIAEAASSTVDSETLEANERHEKAAIHQYGEAILEKYQPLFDLIDSADKDEFTATDLQELFTESLTWLKDNDDPEWAEWEAVAKDGTSLSVDASNRKIKIATRRESATIQDTRGLIAHELLVHALRAKNGYKTGDKKLATGLPGYLVAEEGLGVLAEEAVNGELPDKPYDRYVDIALALGVVDGVQKTRKEMFQISYALQLVRAQLRGDNESTIATLEPRVWGHIDRIYRGGKGDELGTRQAIFTKDIAYCVGYKQMAKYVTQQLDSGKTAAQIFNYLSQAKIDPTNSHHIERLVNPKPATAS
jgi:hypothetical protein